jgi:glycosyltransferase involved in cell wall biosynthesis
VIVVSKIVNQVSRLLDTVFTVVIKSPSYNIAIVPLYGSFKSFIWESVTTKLLKAFKKKVIIVVHGGSIPDKMKLTPKKYLRTLQAADAVVCPSGFLLTTLDEYGIKSTLIENVISLKEYTFRNKKTFRPAIFWMRTIEDIYNPEMGVRVAAILAKKYVDFRMVMAGYNRGSLELVTGLAKELNIADKIEFPGYISLGQKNVYADELDIYICTNRIDNAPVSFIEMMALGLPVVSVNVGGISHLIKNGSNGLLVNLDDDEAMANCITSIIEQPQLGRQLVKNGREFSKQFDEKPVFEKWQKVFNQLGS